MLSLKICVPKETKDINLKAFNMITNKYEAKTMTKHISGDCKYKLNSRTCYSNQKWNNKICQCECKSYCICKKYYKWNLRTCTCENSKYLKSIANTSVIKCDKIITVLDIVATKITDTTARNVTSTALINCHSKKVKDCYILHTVLFLIILLLIITIVCYHYPKQKCITMLTI